MGALTGLSAAKIAQLSAAQIKALSPADIAGMTAGQLMGLTASELSLFDAGQLGALDGKQFSWLSMQTLAGLTPAQMALLTPAQMSSFNVAQIASFTPAQFAAVSASGLSGLSTLQIHAMTRAQVTALTAAQMPGLSSDDIAALSPAEIAALSAGDIAALSAGQIEALTTAQLRALTTAQLGALTADQIGALTPGQRTSLTAKQIAALPTAQTPAQPTPQIVVPPAPQPVVQPAVQPVVQPTPQPDVTPPTPVVQPTPVILPAPVVVPTPQPVVQPTPQPEPQPVVPPAPVVQPAPQPVVQPAPVVQPDPQPVVTPTPVVQPAPVAQPAAQPLAQPAAVLDPTGMTPAQIAALTADQINGLSTAQLANLSITYDTMLGILQADAAGGMTGTEFNALTALVDKFNAKDGITVSDYLQQISDDVVLGSAANTSWTGGGAHATTLGDLSATSTQTQADELIGKWFLGTDLPGSKVNMNGAPNFSVSYAPVSEPLFGAAGPAMSDINQGYLGDCFVLAPLAEMAAQDPSAIESMITANGNNTYSVCFTIDGEADYVTVDNELPGGGTLFNQAPNDWASLIEKAYVQLQAGGAVTGNGANYGNSWSSIANGGAPERTLAEFTGAATVTDYIADGATWKTYTYDGDELTKLNSGTSFKVQSSASNLALDGVQTALAADLAAGDELILSSNSNAVDASGKTTLMSNHSMAVFGFDTATNMFQVYNPWGTEKGQTWDTTFEVSLSTLLAAGDTISVANHTPVAGTAAPSLLGTPAPTGAVNLASFT